jgi:hypothetical protein
MSIRWLTAFVDLPTESFDRGARFWEWATGSTLSAPRGANGEFMTLMPGDGDAYLRVQRVAGAGGIHLDLHTDDVASLVGQGEMLGARAVGGHRYTVMASPGGFTFCVVPHDGELARPQPSAMNSGPVSLVDQVCVDIPDPVFEDEASFWAEFTGWELHATERPAFSYLVRPPDIPLRLLLQRLGTDDRAGAVRAHLDLACGTHVEEVAAQHEVAGAAIVRRYEDWTTMRDPADLVYCLTRRDPLTGRLYAA